MNTKIIKDNLPKGSIIYHEEEFDAITIPADGFQKLIAFHTPKTGTWVHSEWRKKPKKNRKRSKKKG